MNSLKTPLLLAALTPNLWAIPTFRLTAHWTFDANLTSNSVFASGNAYRSSSNEVLFDLKQGNADHPVSFDAAGFRSSAARFTRTNEEFLELSQGGAIIPDTPLSEYSTSVHFRATSVPTGEERYVVYETSPGATLSLSLSEDSENSDNTIIRFSTDHSTDPDPSISFSLPDTEVQGQWIRAIAIWNGSELSGRINDLPPSTIATNSASDFNSFNDLHIGTNQNADGGFFDGYIDELAIWKRALTEEELTGLLTTVTVDSSGRTINPEDGVTTLKEAIENALPHSTITFAPSLSGDSICGGITFSSSVKGITLDASRLQRGLDISGGGTVITLESGAAVALHGITISGGSVPTGAGGISAASNSSLYLVNCRVWGNHSHDHIPKTENAGDGGGIWINSNSVMSFVSCSISGNRAGSGTRSPYGNDGGFGGGIVAFNSRLFFHDCVISGNRSGYGTDYNNQESRRGYSGGDGGGICAVGCRLYLTACTISDNHTGDGTNGGDAGPNIGLVAENPSDGGNGGHGAGFNLHNCVLSLTACTVSGNQTGRGGSGGHGSSAYGYPNAGSGDRGGHGGNGGYGGHGAGIYATGNSNLILTACTVSGNQTGRGGAGGNGGFGSIIDFSDIEDVLEGGYGGHGGDAGRPGNGAGIYMTSSCNLSLTDCTISGNHASLGSAGGNAGDGSGSVNSVDGNAGEGSLDGRGGGIFSSYRFSVSNSIITGNTGKNDYLADSIWPELGNNLLSGNPMLFPLGDYGGPTQTMPPRPSSPVIDAVTDSTLSLDQRNMPIFGDSADIGAAEFQGDSDIRIAAPLVWDLDHDGDGKSFGLEYAIGSDPFRADSGGGQDFTLLPPVEGGLSRLRFGYVSRQNEFFTLRLYRSTDLITFGEEPIASSTDFDDLLDDNGIVDFEDESAPEGGKAFYRLEAILKE